MGHPPMTLADLRQSYLEAVQPGASVRQALGHSWPRFESFCALHGLRDVRDATAAHIQDFHQFLLWEPNSQGHFYKANSLDQILRRVRQVLRWGFASGQLASDPTRELILPRPVQPITEKLSWESCNCSFRPPTAAPPWA